MITSAAHDNEPSAELLSLANRCIRDHRLHQPPDSEVLAEWCDHLNTHSPEVLDLPVLQLVKAVVRARRYSHSTH
ncbi:MAG: hypothetical protein AAF404_22260 [Pseudomonadota bacterium]